MMNDPPIAGDSLCSVSLSVSAAQIKELIKPSFQIKKFHA